MANHKDVVQRVAEKTGRTKKDAGEIIDNFLEALLYHLEKDGIVIVPGHFKLQKILRPARKGRNPQNGETIQIEARTTVKLTALKKLKEAVKE